MSHYLVDTSALGRMRLPSVAARLVPLIEAGDIATCGIVDLEVLITARSSADHVNIKRERDLSFPRIDMRQSDFDRAADVMLRLSEIGLHRAVSLPDLLIAAVAERAGLVILHYDSDYDHIRTATGQATEWVVPQGSLP